MTPNPASQLPKVLLATAVTLSLVAGCNRPEPTQEAPAGSAAPTPGTDHAVAEKPPGRVPAALGAAQIARPLEQVKSCNLERVDGKMFGAEPAAAARSGSLFLSGWLVDAERKETPAQATLRFAQTGGGGTWELPLEAWHERADVANGFGDAPSLLRSGFSVNADLRGMPEAAYRLYLVYADGDALKVCDNGRVLLLK